MSNRNDFPIQATITTNKPPLNPHQKRKDLPSQPLDGRYSSKEIKSLDMMFDPINFINKEFNRLHTKSSVEVET